MIDNTLRYEAMLDSRIREWEAEYMDLLFYYNMLIIEGEDTIHSLSLDQGLTLTSIMLRMDRLEKLLDESHARLGRIRKNYEDYARINAIAPGGADEDFGSVVRRRALRLSLLNASDQNRTCHV